MRWVLVMLNAETLLERHINARGGAVAIQNLQTLQLSGTATFRDGVPAQVNGWRKRPNNLRIHYVWPHKEHIEGWDGRRSRLYAPAQQPVPVFTIGKDADNVRLGAEFDNPLVQAFMKQRDIEYLGACIIAGLPTYGLRVTGQYGSSVVFYLHKDSYMVAAHETIQPIAANKPTITTMFTDYRPVHGVMIPHYSVQVANDGSHNETYSWLNIEANQPLEDAFFSIPTAFLPSQN